MYDYIYVIHVQGSDIFLEASLNICHRNGDAVSCNVIDDKLHRWGCCERWQTFNTNHQNDLTGDIHCQRGFTGFIPKNYLLTSC